MNNTIEYVILKIIVIIAIIYTAILVYYIMSKNKSGGADILHTQNPQTIQIVKSLSKTVPSLI